MFVFFQANASLTVNVTDSFNVLIVTINFSIDLLNPISVVCDFILKVYRGGLENSVIGCESLICYENNFNYTKKY